MDNELVAIHANDADLSKSVSKTQFEAARNKLLKYVGNPDNYRSTQFSIADGLTFGPEVSWEGQNKRRWFYKGCIFRGANLREVGFTGARFVDCRFFDVDISHSIFDLCIFENCTFDANNEVVCNGTSFYNAIFRNTSFMNYAFISSFFSGAQFQAESSMIDVRLEDIVWESASFMGMRFQRVKLFGINIEFTKFLSVDFVDTSLPFASIPFAYGAISYLRECKHVVTIATDGELEENYIDQSQYLKLLPDLESFYRNTNNYFPLANILLETGQTDESFRAIKCGIDLSIFIDDLVLMKHLCVLACNPGFSKVQRDELYNYIVHSLQRGCPGKDRDIALALFEIRDMLLNDRSIPYVTFEIKTSIEHTSYDDMALMLKHLDTIMASAPSGEVKYSIELRHNCPIDILLTAFPDWETIYYIIGALCSVLDTPIRLQELIELFKAAFHGHNVISKEQQKEINARRQSFVQDFRGEDVVDSIVCNAYNVTYAPIELNGRFENCTINIYGAESSLSKT